MLYFIKKFQNYKIIKPERPSIALKEMIAILLKRFFEDHHNFKMIMPKPVNS